jgi:translocation and assembly module TamB
VRLLARVLAFSFALLSAILLSGFYLLHAQRGLEWSYRIAAALLPGELSIEHLEGRLLGPLMLRGVHYHTDTTDLRMAQLDLQWRPGALAGGDLQIASLTIAGLHILRAPSPAAANTLPDVRLPIAVHIDRALVRDLKLGELGKAPSVDITEASLSKAAFEKDRLSLERLEIVAPRYRIDVTGNLSPQRAYPMDIAVQWSADGGEYGAFAGHAQISGDIQHLEIQHQLTAPVAAELRGAVDNPLSKLSWQAELRWPTIDLRKLRDTWPALALSGAVRGKGTLNSMQTEGELHSEYRGLHADHRFAADYDAKGTVKIRRLVTDLRESGAKLTLHGTLADLAHSPQAALEGEWQNLRWPLQGEAMLLSKAGRLNLSGTVQRYQFHVAGELSGERVPAGTWSISGEGDPQQLSVTQDDGDMMIVLLC